MDIGMYKEFDGDGYPMLSALVSSTPIKDKDKVLKHMRSCKVDFVAACKVRDVITGTRTTETLKSYVDGEYSFRSDTIYYFDKYNMKLPDEFIKHALS